MTSKIQGEINRAYAGYEKKVKPLRDKLREKERNDLLDILSKHKGIIYRKKYGKDYYVLKVLKSLTDKGRLVYTKITIEEERDYSIHYIKERNTMSKAEVINLIKASLGGEIGWKKESARNVGKWLKDLIKIMWSF